MRAVGENKHDERSVNRHKHAAHGNSPWLGIEPRRADGTQQAERGNERHGNVVEVPQERDEPLVFYGIAILDEHVEHPEANEQRHALKTVAHPGIRAANMNRETPDGGSRGHKDHETRAGRGHHAKGARREDGKAKRHELGTRHGRRRATKRLQREKDKAQRGTTGTRTGKNPAPKRVIRPAQASSPSRQCPKAFPATHSNVGMHTEFGREAKLRRTFWDVR